VLHGEQGSEPGTVEAKSETQAARMDQLRELALVMFDEQGFEATTADQLAQRAGVSRRTFFRYFPTKEDVIFSDHTDYLARLSELLDERSPDPVRSAARALHALVECFAGNAESICRRARLVVATPALRDRELLWLYEYQQLITDYLLQRGGGTRTVVYAQVISAALVAAMRQVVGAWALGDSDEDPRAQFSELCDGIIESLKTLTTVQKPPMATARDSQLVVVATQLTPDQVARLISETEL
jgi:AcrR family transcriptional regulator